MGKLPPPLFGGEGEANNQWLMLFEGRGNETGEKKRGECKRKKEKEEI
jgi:hypothetical protein